jgi:hypothetical protein
MGVEVVVDVQRAEANTKVVQFFEGNNFSFGWHFKF